MLLRPKLSSNKLSSAKDRLKVSFWSHGAWMMLMVLDWRLEGWGHLWHVGRWSGRYPESLMKIHHDLADWLHLVLGGHWGFLTGDLEDGFIFDIINHVRIWSGRYPVSLMKIGLDMAEKKLVPGGRWGGVGLVFSKFKDRFKPINLY